MFALPAGADADGPCIIEPAVACNHCGYCKSLRPLTPAADAAHPAVIMSKPPVLLTRRIPSVATRTLEDACDVDRNDDGCADARTQLVGALRGTQGVVVPDDRPDRRAR